MTALVQSFPSTSSTITMLQTRPSSSETFQNGTQNQLQRGSQTPRNIYNTSVGGMATGNYRGHTSMSPSASYAFNSPSVVPNSPNPLRQHPTLPRYDTRTASAPVTPLANPISSQSTSTPIQYRLPPLSTPNLSNGFLPQQAGSKDDASIPSSTVKTHQRPLSAIDLNSPALTTVSTTAKPAPDRYRRNHRRAETAGLPTGNSQTSGGSAPPSGSGMATVSHLYNNPLQTSSTPTLTSYPSYRGSPSPSRQANQISNSSQPKVSSLDDMNLHRPGSSEQAKRYRRRSISSLDAKEYQAFNTDQSAPIQAQTAPQPKTYAAILAGPVPQEPKEIRPPFQPAQANRPGSSHGRNGSTESSSSAHSTSRPSSVRSIQPVPSKIVT